MVEEIGRKIPLSQGMYAIVDKDDYKWLVKWKWSVLHANTPRPYAVRMHEKDGKKGQLLMHRQILNTPDGYDTDHIDGDTLNNRRSNLRIATRVQNNGNARLNKRNTSGYRGVSYDKTRMKWAAYIWKNNRKYFLGRFSTSEEAAIAWNNAALEYFGEFAKLNEVKNGNS